MKQETLEEVAERLYPIILEDDGWDKNKQYRDEWIEGVKYQQEQEQDKNKYSEEDMKTAFREGFVKSYDDTSANSIYKREDYLTQWFEQFKKK